MAEATGQYREAALSTPLGEDVLLLESLSGEERLSQPFSYEVVAISDDMAIDPQGTSGSRRVLNA